MDEQPPRTPNRAVAVTVTSCSMIDIRECETCRRERQVFVYALPGIPMSVGNCLECWQNDAYPYNIAAANTAMIGGTEYSAEWWRESMTFKDGTYILIADAFPPGSSEIKKLIEDMNRADADTEDELS